MQSILNYTNGNTRFVQAQSCGTQHIGLILNLPQGIKSKCHLNPKDIALNKRLDQLMWLYYPEIEDLEVILFGKRSKRRKATVDSLTPGKIQRLTNWLRHPLTG
jgi:hypothetical protein